MKEGYLYIANGEKYLNEAIISAKSLRKLDDKAHITLITNKKIKSVIFDKIVVKPENISSWKEGLLYSVEHIYKESPYEKTFFLDSDTYFCGNSRELFNILDYYDVCISHAPNDTSEVKLTNEKFLKGYLPYNTGVILFKKNDDNKKLFSNWYSIYRNKFQEYTMDQVAFMEALLYSKSRVYVLQNIYNARTPFYISLPNLSVKIIHGRCPNYEKIQSELNSVLSNRNWDPCIRRIIAKPK